MSWQIEIIHMTILLLRVGPQQQLGQEVASAIHLAVTVKQAFMGRNVC